MPPADGSRLFRWARDPAACFGRVVLCARGRDDCASRLRAPRFGKSVGLRVGLPSGTVPRGRMGMNRVVWAAVSAVVGALSVAIGSCSATRVGSGESDSSTEATASDSGVDGGDDVVTDDGPGLCDSVNQVHCKRCPDAPDAYWWDECCGIMFGGGIKQGWRCLVDGLRCAQEVYDGACVPGWVCVDGGFQQGVVCTGVGSGDGASPSD
jgi:hypothetical protein